MARTVEEVVELLANRAQTKGIELACLIHEDVPFAVRGDSGRLRQVLINLIGNAIKFTQHGEVVVQVRLHADQTKSAMPRQPPAPHPAPQAGQTCQLSFSIRDTGIGITPEQLSRLFRPFSQADGSMTRKFGGTGLGLSISARLASAMGGRIELRNVPDGGAEVDISFPGA